MLCEACSADSIVESTVALVEEQDVTLPETFSGVATLTGVVCVACWLKLKRPLSCLLYRGRMLTMDEMSPLDMRPLDPTRVAAADRVDFETESARAEALKAKLNRLAVLTFHDPYRAESVLIHRDDWIDPLEIALAVVRMVRELKALGNQAVDEVLDRAGVQLVSPEEPT